MQALVTGATGGVGVAVLGLLGTAGWQVIGVHRGDAARQASARAAWRGAPENLVLHAFDLSDSVAVTALHAALPDDYCPDVILHLAAPPFRAQPLHRTRWSDFGEQLDGVLKPVVEVTQPLLRRMLRRGHGRIITVLSTVVLGQPPRGLASYTTAKHALAAYMSCLAAEYGDRGISANSVSPGPMNTAQLRELPELLREQMRQSTPGNDWIEPEAVARTVLWLAADASHAINGSNIPVTGGVRKVQSA